MIALEGLNWRELGVAIAVPLVGGIAGSIATADQIKSWYKTINKPSWTPPNFLFGPVWTALYTAMGVASYLVWRQGGWASQSVPLTVYAVQLLLNFMWTPLFFKLHKLDWATYDILGMWVMIVATIFQFKGVIGNLAVVLLGPYLLWVSYASALTIWIWRNNTPAVTHTGAGKPKAA